MRPGEMSDGKPVVAMCAEAYCDLCRRFGGNEGTFRSVAGWLVSPFTSQTCLPLTPSALTPHHDNPSREASLEKGRERAQEIEKPHRHLRNIYA